MQMQSLQGGKEAIARLDQLEADYYDLQLQLYEVQFEILKCEELLLTAQLESIKRLISGMMCVLTTQVHKNAFEWMMEFPHVVVCLHRKNVHGY